MNRPRRVWTVFALCLAAVLGAMAWVTVAAVDLDRTRAREQQAARVEQRSRLALWRLDAALMPLIAEQSGRPYFLYALRSVRGQPLDQGNFRTAMAAPVPAKLPTGEPFAAFHFALLSNGNAVAQRPGSIEPVPIENAPDLQWLAAAGNQEVIATRLGNLKTYAAAGFNEVANTLQTQKTDFAQRQQAVNRSSSNVQYQQLANQDLVVANPFAGAKETPAMTMWVQQALLVARRVALGDETYLLGSQLNWPAVRDWMRQEIADLLPDACFEPAPDATGGPHMLATLPVRLLPGTVPTLQRGTSPVMLSLLIAWPCLLAAAAAAGVTLQRTMALSERRAAFVSAVTHELRTPLTTLSMYTEMLSDNTVADPGARAQYLETLRGETSRLCHLVENVLIWSRLDRSGAKPELRTVDPKDMIARIADRLAGRAAQADMQLVIEGLDTLGDDPVTTDPAAVEQILFNLVDNAAKYAAAAADKRIHLSCTREPSGLTITVRDHGPGIDPADAERIFRSFQRATRDSAASLGGVGLGLSICRRLASALRTQLTLTPSPDGAAFTLTIE